MDDHTLPTAARVATPAAASRKLREVVEAVLQLPEEAQD